MYIKQDHKAEHDRAWNSAYIIGYLSITHPDKIIGLGHLAPQPAINGFRAGSEQASMDKVVGLQLTYAELLEHVKE